MKRLSVLKMKTQNEGGPDIDVCTIIQYAYFDFVAVLIASKILLTYVTTNALDLGQPFFNILKLNIWTKTLLVQVLVFLEFSVLFVV